MKKITPIFALAILALLGSLLASPLLSAQAAGQPGITQLGIDPGKQVQVQFTNLPANTDFTVTESAVGNMGRGPVIAHFNSGDGGTRTYWFEVLTDVRDKEKAELRIDSGTGFFAYIVFNNTASFSQTVTPTPTGTLTATAVVTSTPVPTSTGSTGGVIPSTILPVRGTINVVHVQKGGLVTATLMGLPKDTTFSVVVGMAGSMGYGGYKVANLYTSSGVDRTSTFEIPVLLSTQSSLDLRIEAPGYLYLVTFKNTDF